MKNKKIEIVEIDHNGKIHGPLGPVSPFARFATLPTAPAAVPAVIPDESPSLPNLDDLPARPPTKPGHVCELCIRDGEFAWRYRRPDAADIAYENFTAGDQPLVERAPGETAVERAERYRADWEVNGYSPGVSRRNP